ncbi:MAG: methyltransferase domain-containing protein [Candidatus Omnitrophica bacterium]|nr:methyltransferase domain-containing protein [Candidatus Omnitrophota bacterium]
MTSLNKYKIIRNFTRAADKYEGHSGAQRECALKLNAMVANDTFSSILEIGPGTGHLTRLLLSVNGMARITAVDISRRMAENLASDIVSPYLSIVNADGEYFDNGEKYDLIISNAAFQWFDDLYGALDHYANMLNERGVLAFSIYAPGTFRELKEALSVIFGKPISMSADNFPSMNELGRSLEEPFRKLVLETANITVRYGSLRDLLCDIKNSGAQGPGTSGNFYFGKKAINDMEKVFIERYGSVLATHSVIFFKGAVNDRKKP